MNKLIIILFILIKIICSPANEKAKRNLQSEKSNDIIILHTNDVHCGVNDVIGYDGLNLYKKELKTKYKHVLLVDAGDNIQGGAIGLLSKGKDIINITNYLEYDVVTIGNHEFDYKAETLFRYF
jgi:2',3'-cyclic-nucleotide 2'-phosphodiesterase (5'-nucleotidase family)